MVNDYLNNNINIYFINGENMIFHNDFMSINFSPSRGNLTAKSIKDTIIISISGIGHEDEADKYILLEDSFEDFNILGITNKKRDFFINNSTESALDFLKSFLSNFSRIIIISHSMGGFFAFYISTYIEVDLCIVCSPYLSLSESEMNLNDSEERLLFDKLNSSYIENYCLKNVKISHLSPKKQDKFIVILDLSIKDDVKTFYLIDKYLNKINTVILPGIGHLSLYYLEKRKIISSVIRSELEEGSPLSTKKILDNILNYYLEFTISEKSKICIKNQIYFNDKDIYKNYYSFVYDFIPYKESKDLFLILNKHGYMMSFFYSISGFFWSETPFEDSRFSPVVINIEQRKCFCFYDCDYIEVDYEIISAEVNKIGKNYIKIPFSEEFFINYFGKLNFNDKINIFSAINLNKKHQKNNDSFSFSRKIRRIFGIKGV